MTRPDLAVRRRINWSTLTATHAQQRPDQDALRFKGEARTWSEIDERVSRVASWLRDRGVGAGDRVALLTMNTPEFVEVVIAAARIGAIALPLNFRLSAPEVAFILGDSTPSVVVAEGPFVPLLLAAGVEPADLVVIGGDPPAGATAFEDAVAAGSPEQVLDDVDDNAPAMIMYTSGTTGRPKGAVLTHLNLFVQGLTNIRAFHLVGDDVVLVGTPLFHIAAVSSLLPVLINGGVAVLQPLGAFDPAELLDVLERERVTSVFLVPAQWQAIVAQPSVRDRDLVLRNTSWGAAPATPTLLQAMAEAFPNALNVAAFGQTEMSPVTCVLLGEDAIRKLGSVGKPVSYVQLRVVDALDQDVAPGEVGEAIYRGPTMMDGYWNRPDADDEAFRGGWFHSGDLVRVDEEGFVYVVDRLKDMIISGGENIYCAEVENALAPHPAILEAAVVGRPSERWGEEPVAFLVLRDGHEAPTLDELKEWLGDRLASYKHPKAIHVSPELPRNASGKVQKFTLRDSA